MAIADELKNRLWRAHQTPNSSRFSEEENLTFVSVGWTEYKEGAGVGFDMVAHIGDRITERKIIRCIEGVWEFRIGKGDWTKIERLDAAKHLKEWREVAVWDVYSWQQFLRHKEWTKLMGFTS